MELCNNVRTLCDGIAPVHNPSKAVFQIKNVGLVVEDYTVYFDNCTHPVVAIAPQTITVAAGATTEVAFQVCLNSSSSMLSACLRRQTLRHVVS